MGLIIPLFLVMFGTSVNDYNSGGVQNFDEAKTKVIASYKERTPVDYSLLNK